jgi:Transposase DDE domain group 1
MKKHDDTPSTWKVRRRARGGKRAQGWVMQKEGRRIRRPDPSVIKVKQDTSLTSVAGLVEFGAWARALGVDRELTATFGRLKELNDRVVYPMGAQLRLLLDTFVAGEGRVFAVESLAADALFLHLCGGSVPSTDVLYDDLNRFDPQGVVDAEAMVAAHGLARGKAARLRTAHLDVDTTVEVLFGSQEGALAGPNPRYHGRNSYHPLIMRIGEVDAVVGAQLRPGDTGFGSQDVPTVTHWIRRTRAALGKQCVLRVRIDAAGDCAELMEAVDREGAVLLTKAKMTPDLIGALAAHSPWRTVDVDAHGRPTRQVATLVFQRDVWKQRELPVRVIAVRSRERDNGKQIYLWEDEEWTAQAFLTNDWMSDEDDLAQEYNDRAGIEPLLAELKGPWAIGKVPTAGFDANHAMFLLKLLAFNLFRRFIDDRFAALAQWRTAWARRVTILRAGRLVRSAGRSRVLKAQPVARAMRC